jgi:hypothetical protein
MQSIREALDGDTEFTPETDFASMCEIFIEFLKVLETPVVPLEHLDLHCLMFV